MVTFIGANSVNGFTLFSGRPCPLRTYQGDHIESPVVVEKGFLGRMDTINGFARDCGVTVGLG